MIGLRTSTATGGLILTYHIPLVASLVSLVFFGRLALNLFWWSRSPAHTKVSSRTDTLKKGLGITALPLPRISLILVFALPIILFVLNAKFSLGLPLRYWFDNATLVLTYIMLGWGLNIVVGMAGLLDLGYVAFYAGGAYSYALLAQHFGLSFWLCLPLAGLLAAGWGVLLGFPVLRLRGDYLAIATLAFGEIILIVLLNWYQFTSGPDGLSGISRPSFLGCLSNDVATTLSTYSLDWNIPHCTGYYSCTISF